MMMEKIRTFFHFLIHHKTVVHQSETVQFAFKFRVTTTLLIVEYFSSAVKKENFHPLQEKLEEKKKFLGGNHKKNILENFKKIKIFSKIFMTVRAKNVISVWTENELIEWKFLKIRLDFNSN